MTLLIPLAKSALMLSSLVAAVNAPPTPSRNTVGPGIVQSISGSPTSTPSPTPSPSPTISTSPLAFHLHQLPAPWPCLAWYESTDNPRAVNPVSGTGGLWQIAATTWQEFGGTQLSTTPQSAPPASQYLIATRIQAVQGWSAWETAPLCGV